MDEHSLGRGRMSAVNERAAGRDECAERRNECKKGGASGAEKQRKRKGISSAALKGQSRGTTEKDDEPRRLRLTVTWITPGKLR